MKTGRLLKNIAAAIVVGIIAYFLARSLAANWQAIQPGRLEIEYRWVFLAYLPLALSFILGVSGWRYILKSLGSDLPWTRCFWTISGSHLAKFVPGHVLALGGRIWLCDREGVPKTSAATGVVLEMIAQLAASALVFTLYFLSAHRKAGALYLLAALALFSILMVLAHPAILRRVWRFLPKYGKTIEGRVSHSYNNVVALAVIYTGAWAMQGAGVWCLARSIQPDLPAAAMLSTVGAYGGAYALGFISLVTPGGLGVREGALSYLLSGLMPLPLAIIVAVGSRIWLTVFDVAMTLISIKFYKPGASNAKA
jgi:hypothetical protein